jgi:hypothetical protein
MTTIAQPKCFYCWDSGIEVRKADYESEQVEIKECRHCEASQTPTGHRVFGAVSARMLLGKKIGPAMLAMARALVPASAQEPVQGDELISVVEATGKEPLRFVKLTARRLRTEWRLPVCGNREEPYGYFIARNSQEFLEWMRTTRSQAISELATAYQLFKSNFPELSGQKSLEFVETVSTELKEAIR